MKPLLFPRKKFTGKLAKPVKLGANTWEAMLEVMEKLDLLFEHYSIASPVDPKIAYESWNRLAFKLAFEFVPGFQFVAPKKRGPKINLVTPLLLIVDVEKIKEKEQCSVREAIKILVSRSRGVQRWQGKNKRTLENWYHRAVRSKDLWQFVDSL